MPENLNDSSRKLRALADTHYRLWTLHQSSHLNYKQYRPHILWATYPLDILPPDKVGRIRECRAGKVALSFPLYFRLLFLALLAFQRPSATRVQGIPFGTQAVIAAFTASHYTQLTATHEQSAQLFVEISTI